MLIRHLPPDSALGAADRDGAPLWTLTDHLLDDLRMSQVGTKKNPASPHPLRPKPRRRHDPQKVASSKRRAARRRERIASGDLT